MDKKQLVTIAVTALISVMAKEIVTWLFSLAKSQAAKETTKARVRSMFRPYILAVIWNAIMFLASILFLVSNIRRPGPITRFDVFMISFWLLMACGNGAFLVSSLGFAVGYRRARRLSENSPSSPQD
jgi:hypothetical protein